MKSIFAAIGGFFTALFISITKDHLSLKNDIKKANKLQKKYDKIDSMEDQRDDDEILKGGG